MRFLLLKKIPSDQSSGFVDLGIGVTPSPSNQRSLVTDSEISDEINPVYRCLAASEMQMVFLVFIKDGMGKKLHPIYFCQALNNLPPPSSATCVVPLSRVSSRKHNYKLSGPK